MDFKKALEQVNAFSKNTLMETLGIEYTEIGPDFLVATMPVTSKVHQPMGLLHGGATIALAESVGSAASFLFVNPNEFTVKGLEVSANHLKSKKEGVVTAKAINIHRGSTTHLWQVEVRDEEGALISICKITNIVLPKK